MDYCLGLNQIGLHLVIHSFICGEWYHFNTFTGLFHKSSSCGPVVLCHIQPVSPLFDRLLYFIVLDKIFLVFTLCLSKTGTEVGSGMGSSSSKILTPFQFMETVSKIQFLFRVKTHVFSVVLNLITVHMPSQGFYLNGCVIVPIIYKQVKGTTPLEFVAIIPSQWSA